jgi:hypothetical protein
VWDWCDGYLRTPGVHLWRLRLPYVLTAEQDLQVVLKAVRLMDELGILSPASRERSLDELPRKELQQLAKEAGVKVTSDSCHLL